MSYRRPLTNAESTVDTLLDGTPIQFSLRPAHLDTETLQPRLDWLEVSESPSRLVSNLEKHGASESERNLETLGLSRALNRIS